MPRPSWQTALTNGIIISGMLLGGTSWAAAQSRPLADDTLGNERSVVVPLGTNTPGDRISGGARRGDNLFHSLQQLNVDAGRSVYFSDPGVNNIITRVTGGTRSQIDGVLGVLQGNANLFLINPSGIIFGANATLDVGGSFTATTADAIKFGNQGDFSATTPTSPALLTVQPSAFAFNQINPAPITNNSRTPARVNPSGLSGLGLRVPEGRSLTLLGGNINMNGGGVNALGGRAEIGGLGAPGTVTLNADGSLSFPSGVALSDVLLANQSFVDVAANGGGSITINAGDFEILGSRLSAGIGRNSGSVGAQAGDITLKANTIRGAEQAFIANQVAVGGIGDAGDVSIFVSSLSLTNTARLDASTFGQGNAGDVIINARALVALDTSYISTNVRFNDSDATSVGKGGDIRIFAGSLSLTNGAALVASTFRKGDAGNVIINARDRVLIDGTNPIDPNFSSAIVSTNGARNNANQFAVGNSGDIRITTGSLSLTNGAQLVTNTFGKGNAGNVIINARESVTFDNSDVFSEVNSNNANQIAVGNGGDIRIFAGSLFLNNRAQLAARTFGQGNAGNVIIDVRDRVALDKSYILSTVGYNDSDATAVGNGGAIRILAGSFFLTNGAALVASTLREGNAGDVIIIARDRVLIDGVDPTRPSAPSAIFSTNGGNDNQNQFAVGKGGDIRIFAGSFSLTNGAQLSASTLGEGDAGNVIIDARDRVLIDGVNSTSPNLPSAIFSRVDQFAVGKGGDIRITTDSLSLTNGARLTANTLGKGDAGNVIINARDRVLIDDANPSRPNAPSAIFSNVDQFAVGNGGDIRIFAGSLSLTNEARLSAGTLGKGNAGSVIIDARDRVALDESYIFSTVESNNSDAIAVGKGGDVRITIKGSLFLTSGAQLTASTFGQGDAGNVIINARDRVVVEGGDQLGFSSAIFSTTQAGAEGRGGSVSITADAVRIADGALFSAETENSFSGGSITITSNTFEATEGGRVITTTSGSGQAGNIYLNTRDRITLSGVAPRDSISISGLYADTTSKSSGTGGTVQIATEQLQVFDRATIAVNSQGEGIAGNINIAANRVQLNDSSRLSAETTTVNGGNITLRDVELLQLGNSSSISTTAGTARAGGNGGNIDIDSDLIVAFPNENSDIRANAFTGSGGNVFIDSQGLFGIAFQAQDNPRTNDITASSEQGLQGNVDISLPEIDPRRDLTQLPENVVDVSSRIAQGCRGSNGVRQNRGEFIVKGRGGLPPSPTDSLVGDESLATWVTLAQTNGQATYTTMPAPEPRGAAAPIVEAQAWIVDEKGKVTLVANAPTSATQPNLICQRQENK